MSDEASIPKIQARNLFSVNGLNVVITGGGTGIGAMMARALAVNGANKVFIIGRRSESLNTVMSSIPNGDKIIVPIVGDVTSKDSLSSAVSTVKSHVQHLDVLIANSGTFGPSVALTDDKNEPLPLATVANNILNQDSEHAVDTWRVNVVGVQLTIGAFLPLLDAANKARPQPTADNFKPRPQIIIIGSVSGYSRQAFGSLCYGPCKSAVIQLSKMLSTTLIPYDIRVNCLAPGLYLTEMTRTQLRPYGLAETDNVEGTFPKIMSPATRGGNEEDMSGCILYMCSRAGAHMNGNVLVTDGGRLSIIQSSY